MCPGTRRPRWEGLDAGDPVGVLRATLRGAAPVRRDTGIEGLLRALPAAGRGDTPSDLALLCACVLAASRRDGKMVLYRLTGSGRALLAAVLSVSETIA